MERLGRPETVVDQDKQPLELTVRCNRHREIPALETESPSECIDHPISIERMAEFLDICVSWGFRVNPREVAQIDFDRLLEAGVVQYQEDGFAFCEKASVEALDHIVEVRESFAELILARIAASRKQELSRRKVRKRVNQAVADKVIELLLSSGRLERVGQSFRFEGETFEWSHDELCWKLEESFYYTRIRRRSVNSMLKRLTQEGRVQRKGLRYAVPSED